MSRQLHIEPGWCVGSGYCANTAGRVFALSADDVVELVGVDAGVTDRDIPDDLIDAVERAAAQCPIGAIELVGDV